MLVSTSVGKKQCFVSRLVPGILLVGAWIQIRLQEGKITRKEESEKRFVFLSIWALSAESFSCCQCSFICTISRNFVPFRCSQNYPFIARKKETVLANSRFQL